MARLVGRYFTPTNVWADVVVFGFTTRPVSEVAEEAIRFCSEEDHVIIGWERTTLEFRIYLSKVRHG